MSETTNIGNVLDALREEAKQIRTQTEPLFERLRYLDSAIAALCRLIDPNDLNGMDQRVGRLVAVLRGSDKPMRPAEISDALGIKDPKGRQVIAMSLHNAATQRQYPRIKRVGHGLYAIQENEGSHE